MKRFVHAVRVFTILAMLATVSLGCNTFRGMGRDIERGGEAIQDATD